MLHFLSRTYDLKSMKDIGQPTSKANGKKSTRAGKLLVAALDILSDTTMNMVDFTVAFLEAGYGASGKKIQYIFDQRSSSSESSQTALKSKCRNLIYRLKRDGLITDIKGSGANRIIALTKKGREKRLALNSALQFGLDKYAKEPSDSWIIISFDVPKEDNRKRDWLRSVIKNLGYEMIQQSVWIGKIQIPKELITDLKKHNMINYVEFFEVKKMGSLQ